MAMFVQDTFSTAGTNALDARTGETGATWTRRTGTADTKVTGGFLYSQGTQVYTASGTPGGTDYEATLWATYMGNAGNDFHLSGPAVVLDSSGNGYFAAWQTDSAAIIGLWKLTSGSRTLLTSVSQSAPSANTAYKLALKRIWTGSTNKLTVTLDDVVKINEHTDASWTGNGLAGLHLRASISDPPYGGSPTDGSKLNAIEVWDIAGASITLQQVERGRGVARGLGRGL